LRGGSAWPGPSWGFVSPHKAKSRLADLRVGLLYPATFAPGTTGEGDSVTLQADFTPRYNAGDRQTGEEAGSGRHLHEGRPEEDLRPGAVG